MKIQRSQLPTEWICTVPARSNPDGVLVDACAKINAVLKQQLGEGAPQVMWTNILDAEINPDGVMGRFLIHAWKDADHGGEGVLIPTGDQIRQGSNIA